MKIGLSLPLTRLCTEDAWYPSAESASTRSPVCWYDFCQREACNEMANQLRKEQSVGLPSGKRNVLVVSGALRLIALLLAGSGGIAGAAPWSVTPSPPPTTGPPREPPANIPVYSAAHLQGVHQATVTSHQATTWAYTVSGPDVTLSSVTRFYEQDMPRNGWVQQEAVPPEQVHGVSGATVLVYLQQAPPGPPTQGRIQGQPMAIIAAGTNNQTNPPEIGFVITLVE